MGLDSCSGMRRQILHRVSLSPLATDFVKWFEIWFNDSSNEKLPLLTWGWLFLQRCTSVGGAGLPRLDDEVWHNKRHQEPDHVVFGDVDIYKTVGWPLPSVSFLAEGHQTVQMCTCFHCSPVSFTYVCTRVGNKGQQHAWSRRLHTEERVDPPSL